MARGIGKKKEREIKKRFLGDDRKYITRKIYTEAGFNSKEEYLEHYNNVLKNERKTESNRVKKDIKTFMSWVQDEPTIQKKQRKMPTSQRTHHAWRDGDTRIVYPFTFKDIDRLDFDEDIDFANEVMADIRLAASLPSIQKLIQNNDYMRIVVSMTTGKMVSTKFLPYNDALADFLRKFLEYLRKYDEDGDLLKFELQFYIPNPLIGAGSVTRSIAKANETWKIVDVPTKTNCMWVASLLGKKQQMYSDYMKDLPRLYKDATNLKLRTKARGGNVRRMTAQGEDIQLCANYLKRTIIVYGNAFNKIAEYTPANLFKDKRTTPKNKIEIQCERGHYKSLLRWKDIGENFVPMEEDNWLWEAEDEDFVIDKKKGFQPELYHKYAAYDIEASPNPSDNFFHKAYACGISYILDRVIYHRQFWGMDCQKKFIRFLVENFDIFKGYTIYAHNGGKYDYPNLLREALLDFKDITIDPLKWVELNGRIISFAITNGKGYINFKDSLCIFANQGLDDITKEMKVQHQKLKELVNHKNITLDNYLTHKPEIKKYLQHDCTGLLECIIEFAKEAFYATGINLKEAFTGATLSKKFYYKKHYQPNKWPIFFLSRKKDAFVRNTYIGGRNEAFYIGKINHKVWYDDFTSLFPDVGRSDLPFGRPSWVTFKDNKDFENFYGFCDVSVRSIDFKRKPLHAVLKEVDHSKRLLFPYFEKWTTLRLYSEEIRLGMKTKMYEYDFANCEGIAFEKAPLLKPFFEECFKKKQQANDSPALRMIWKLIANSGYGFWGLKWMNRESTLLEKTNDCTASQYLGDGKLINRCEWPNSEYTTLTVEKDLEMTDFNVAIASAITSSARMKLWNSIIDIEDKGYEVYYCDTDSIISNCNINDHPDLLAKYRPDGTGDNLGDLKSEGLDKLSKYNKNHDVKIDIANVGLYFDECVIAGCKFYGLRKDCGNGVVIDITKLKGYKDKKGVPYDILVDHMEGRCGHIEQNQEQFSLPRSSMVDENRRFGLNVLPVHKTFKSNYKKGNVITKGSRKGFVEPFRL
jgi:hypothetical protein